MNENNNTYKKELEENKNISKKNDEEEEEEEVIEEEIEIEEEEEEDEDEEQRKKNREKEENKMFDSNKKSSRENNMDNNIINNNLDNIENENDIENMSNNFSFGSPKLENKNSKLINETENEKDIYEDNLKINLIEYEKNVKNENSNQVINDYNDSGNIPYGYNVEQEKETNENAPDSIIEEENQEIIKDKNFNDQNNNNINKNLLNRINENKEDIIIKNAKEDADNNKEKTNIEQSEEKNCPQKELIISTSERKNENKENINKENKEKDDIEIIQINEINSYKDKKEDLNQYKEKEKEKSNNKSNYQNLVNINYENKNESIISNEKFEENDFQNSEVYKDYSNEEKEKEEGENEEGEENQIKNSNENIDKEENNEKELNKNIENNKVNENVNQNIDQDDENKNSSKKNIKEMNRETPSRKKVIEPHQSPTFNIYGNNFNTPTPLSSKDNIEVIIEKPKEDEEREDNIKENENNNDFNHNNINKLNKDINNINNEDNHRLFYTHLNPQIIDNTSKNKNYSDTPNNLIEKNNLNKEELRTLNSNNNDNITDKGIKKYNDDIEEEDEEDEEIEDEEEEEDDNESEDKKTIIINYNKKMKKETNYKYNNNNRNNINDNNSYKVNNLTNDKLIYDDNNNNNNKNLLIVNELPNKNENPENSLEKNNINNINNNNQVKQKIIEYENKNQYTFPNMQLFKNNFTYIKKNNYGNASFRSFNKSLKNKISMNNSLNNNNISNAQQTVSNISERKIIGIYSKPNNYIENLEKQKKEGKKKENKKEQKFDKTPNIYELNKMKLNDNINNLGNEYLHKLKKKKNEINQSENDEYEDYEVSSENDQIKNESHNNSSKIIYNKKIFLMKKEKLNNITNDKYEIKKNEIQNIIKKRNSLNNNKLKVEDIEEESEEESYEIEESEEEYNENEDEEDSKQGEIIEEKRQFKKKDKKKQYLDENKYNNTIDVSEENDSNNNIKFESESSNGKEEIGVEPENENEKIFLLELEDNGLPNLKDNEILTCNINSLINLSVPRGKEISNEISLISNCENDFPDPFYLNQIIEDNKKNNQNDKINNINLNFNSSIENNQIKKSLKPYQIHPNKTNSKIYFRIICKKAGNIVFVIMYKDSTQNNKIKFTKPFYILVNPIINIKNNNPVEINQMQIQSILSHKIGYLSTDFENYYEEAYLLGYNFIHFRTLHKLTKENNIYLLKDHNELNDSFFRESNRLRKNQKIQQLSNIIQNLNAKYKMGCITDIILHQASNESEWILEHSECAYNLENTPWLNVSYELDKILVNYSNLFYQKKVKCFSAPYINNINDINNIINEINEEIIKSKLEEFFFISLEKYFIHFKNFYKKIMKNLKNQNLLNQLSLLINELKISLKNTNNIRNIINNKNSITEIILKTCKNYGYKRYGVEINVEFVSLLIISLYHFEKKGIPTEYYFLKEIKIYIENMNNLWKEKIKGIINIALLNTKEYLVYKYLQLNNKNKIKNLIESYFYIYNKNDSKKIFLCNGWIMNSESEDNLFPDITKYGTWYLLKRNLIVFKNSIKINYGNNLQSTPNYLMKYMNKYITDLSKIFDGLYIDSIQYLPLFILKYFIDIARKINPNIIFICQIAEGKNELNIMKNIIRNKKKFINQIELLKKRYVEELGINLFINEVLWNKDWNLLIKNIIKNSYNYKNNIYNEIISHFNNNLYSSTAIEDNQVYLGKFVYLKPKTPLNIIFNINYQNIPYLEKLKLSSVNLSILSLIGLMDTSIGNIYELDKYFIDNSKNLNKMKKYKFNVKDMKNLIQKIKNTKYHNEESLEVFFEFHPNRKIYENIKNIKSVKLALNNHDWRPDIELTKIKEDLFMTKIRLSIGKYYYKYVINDEIWGHDETQPIEKDNNGNINNVIDLTNHNKIIIQNLKMYLKEINNIRTFFKNKNSEIYVQKKDDLICIIRVLADYNSLINKSISDHDILACKNKILFYEDKKQMENSNFIENEALTEINNSKENLNDRIIKKEINFKFNSKSKLSRSLEKMNKYQDNESFDSSGEIKIDFNYFTKKKYMIYGSPNFKKMDKFSSPYKEKEQDNNIKIFKSNNSLLDASMDVNLGNSSNNICQSILNKNSNSSNNDINNSFYINYEDNKIFNDEINYYDGHAIICHPTYSKKQLGKGIITIPGKIMELNCACFINEDISYNSSKNNNKYKKEIYFTKNINHLKNIISSVNYYNNKTIIQFTNIPANSGLILKFKLGETIKNVINNLNKNLEIIFNKGNEFINYFDLNDINNLLFESDKELKNNKKTYEITINLFNDYDEKKKLSHANNLIFKYAGLNQLVEIIKMIKRTECLNFENKSEELNENQKFMESLYKDILTSDGLINYILARLNEAKSFKLIHGFLKKLILNDYKSLPNYIKPIYFEKIIISLHHAIMSFSLKE